MSVKVFGDTFSTYTMRVIFTALELGHPVKLVPVNFMKGEHKHAEHLARQPFGRLPAMQDGEFVLYESVAICRYLVDKYAGDSACELIPTAINDKAIFEQFMSLEATTFQPEIAHLCEIWFHSLVGHCTRDEEACKKALDNLMHYGSVLNNQLEGKTWIVNDKFSLVDITMVTFLAPAAFARQPEIQQWFAKYPNIGAWYKNITARPAFQQTQSLQDLSAWWPSCSR